MLPKKNGPYLYIYLLFILYNFLFSLGKREEKKKIVTFCKINCYTWSSQLLTLPGKNAAQARRNAGFFVSGPMLNGDVSPRPKSPLKRFKPPLKRPKSPHQEVQKPHQEVQNPFQGVKKPSQIGLETRPICQKHVTRNLSDPLNL